MVEEEVIKHIGDCACRYCTLNRSFNEINNRWEKFIMDAVASRSDQVRYVHQDKLKEEIAHPSHYTVGGLEVIDILRAKMSREEFVGYLKGNVLKYVMRHNHKGRSLEDLDKAQLYLKWLKDELSADKPAELDNQSRYQEMMRGCVHCGRTPPCGYDHARNTNDSIDLGRNAQGPSK